MGIVCIKKVVDRKLEVELEGLLYRSGDISKEVGCHEDLMELDSNGDGVLEVDDLVGTSKYLPRDPIKCALQPAVSKAFVSSGIISKKQGMAVKHFFKLYNRVERIHEIVIDGVKDELKGISTPSWKMVHSDTWGRELEFDGHSYWKACVEPHVAGNGILTNYFDYGLGTKYSFAVFMPSRESVTGYGLGYQLAEEMRMALDDLAGIKKEKAGGGTANGSSIVYKVDTRKIPKVIREQTERMIGWYNDIAEFLNGYREVECDGAGCGMRDEYELYRFTKIVDVAPQQTKNQAEGV